ncbi:MAG: carbohydrate ABC transporter permease [Lachnospiraceae bacterium]|nr:carbohydrate ABC transporter permease [Lachnospiraceae bacterium]
MVKKQTKGQKIRAYLILTVVALLFMFPLVWMIASSFKNDAQIFGDISSIRAFWPTFNKEPFFNYKSVVAKLPLLSSMLHSILYIFVTITLSLIINSMAGYALARIRFPKKKLIMTAILAVMIIPTQTVMLPQFSIIYKLHCTNSYLGLILPALANPMYIYLFRQQFLGIPESIEEAAKLDGAGQLRIFFQLFVPLAKPIYATVTILQFVLMWNDFVWPVMVISDTKKQTVQMALSSLFNIKPVNYGDVMAGLTIVTIPVLVLFLTLQKYYVAGIASTGAKD